MAFEPSGGDHETREGATRDLALAREQLAAELEIHRAVAGQLDRKALFTAVARALRRISPARSVILLVPSTDPSALRVYAADGKMGIRFFEGESIPRATTIAGWVVEHRLPLVAKAADEIRERFPTSYERLRQEGMDSIAVVPLLAGGRCLGALSLMAEQAGAWESVPKQLLEEIAASVAVAVDLSVTYEELVNLRDEETALLDINRAVARHLRRDELFATLAQCLNPVLRSDRFGIELPIPGGKLRAHVLSPQQGAAPAQVEELAAAGTACHWVETKRQTLVASSRAELREPFPVTFDVMSREAMESLCALPLVTGERCVGVLFLMAAREAAYTDLRRGVLEQVASAVAVALDHCLAYEELQALRDRLAAENVYLQEEIRQDHDFLGIVGRSPVLLQLLRRVEAVAPTDSTVLILGETGTGKELIARAVHDHSRRRDRPLVKVNCSAISAGLVESELFGHVRGAFTGAVTARVGRFELADGGTIFLDEIGDLPLDTQVKLLRVLQEREFEPVGSSRTRRVDVRVIAATNRDLEKAVGEGRFRADLYYRLNVLPLVVPPLRDRREDVSLLVHLFAERYAREMGKPVPRVTEAVIAALTSYPWPGNVRELQNVIERAIVLSQGDTLPIEGQLLPQPADAREHRSPAAAVESRPETPESLEAVERRHIEVTLERCGWKIEGPHGAAADLGLNPSTLRSRIKKLGIQRVARP